MHVLNGKTGLPEEVSDLIERDQFVALEVVVEVSVRTVLENDVDDSVFLEKVDYFQDVLVVQFLVSLQLPLNVFLVQRAQPSKVNYLHCVHSSFVSRSVHLAEGPVSYFFKQIEFLDRTELGGVAIREHEFE